MRHRSSGLSSERAGSGRPKRGARTARRPPRAQQRLSALSGAACEVATRPIRQLVECRRLRLCSPRVFWERGRVPRPRADVRAAAASPRRPRNDTRLGRAVKRRTAGARALGAPCERAHKATGIVRAGGAIAGSDRRAARALGVALAAPRRLAGAGDHRLECRAVLVARGRRRHLRCAILVIVRCPSLRSA